MVDLRFSDDLCLSDYKCISNVLLSQKEKTFQQTDISYDIGRKAMRKKVERFRKQQIWKVNSNRKYKYEKILIKHENMKSKKHLSRKCSYEKWKWNPIESANVKSEIR